MAQDVVPLSPLPTPSGGAGEGSDTLVADLMKDFVPPQAAPAPTIPPADDGKKQDTPPSSSPGVTGKKDDTKLSPSGTPVQTPPKAAPAAPPKEIDPDDPKIPAADLRKELKRVRESSTLTVREREKQIGELTGKISDFEKRRYWTDADLKAHEAANKRLAELESELYSRDYASSPEYKNKYQDRFDQIWNEAKQEVVGLMVKYQDGTAPDADGKEMPVWKERSATERDLLAVIDAPLSDRMAIAKRLFGEDRDAVLQWARDIAAVRKDAARAIEEKRTGYASETTKRQQQAMEANQKINGFIQQATSNLEKAHPDIFTAPADKPDLAEALKKGFGFVDESSSKMMEYDINTRAARAAMVRALAGAAPRLILERSQMAARIAELEGQLEKFQKSDPSELGGGGGGGRAAGDKDGGSDTLAAEIDALNKK